MNKTTSLTETHTIPIPKYFIKVPKEVILSSSLPEHRVSVLAYLWYNQTWDERVHYSPYYMLEWCGYKATWRGGTKENIYTKFRDCMQWYFEHGYLVDFTPEKYKAATFQSSLLNSEKLLPCKDYGMLYDFEIERIMEYKSTYKPINKSVLLLLLSYIRAHTHLRPSNISTFSTESKPEIFHSQFQSMAQAIGVRPRLISKATAVLETLGLIKSHRMPCYQDKNGVWHTGALILVSPYKVSVNKVDTSYDWNEELKRGIDYFYRKIIQRKTKNIKKDLSDGE